MLSKKIEDMMNQLGRERSQRIFCAYADQHFDMIKAFVEKKINEEKGSSIKESIKLGLTPMDLKIVMYLQDALKSERKFQQLMAEFLEENEEHALNFVYNHPEYVASTEQQGV